MSEPLHGVSSAVEHTGLTRGFPASFVRALGNWFVSVLPTNSTLLYRFCGKVVDRYNGDNNCDMATNGELRLMRSALLNTTVVFDVGANVRDWTSEALKINPTAHYHCFEPSPTTYTSLAARALPGNVRLNNVGLGDVEGHRPLFIFGDGYGVNSLYNRRGTDAVTQCQETVCIETLDGYCKKNAVQRIDFIKLDVEGHELFVLRGGECLLQQGQIGVIQFEYGGTYIDARVLLKDIWEYVQAMNPNYSFYKLYPSGLRLVPAYRQTLETFQYSNWVIMHQNSCKWALG